MNHYDLSFANKHCKTGTNFPFAYYACSETLRDALTNSKVQIISNQAKGFEMLSFLSYTFLYLSCTSIYHTWNRRFWGHLRVLLRGVEMLIFRNILRIYLIDDSLRWFNTYESGVTYGLEMSHTIECLKTFISSEYSNSLQIRSTSGSIYLNYLIWAGESF